MAFALTGWYRTSNSMNSESVTNYTTGIVSPREGCMAMYGYISATDTLATILTAGYFVSRAGDLGPGDFINVQGTDGSALVRVSFVRVANDSLIAPSVLYSLASSGTVLSSEVAITSAQVLALNTTAITMVPAVPGYKALFLGGEASVAFATTAYTFAGTLVWEYGTGGVDVSSTIAAGLLTAVASSSATAIPVAVATIAEATVANNAIVFRASANPTVGDSPLTVRTFYTLVPSP